LNVVTLVQPETLVRWHRVGFRRYWFWKSNSRGGRPQIETELRALIRQLSTENQLWGAPRIHGELLKLGFSIAQSTVATYMVKRRGSPSQGWRAFLHNHAPDIAAWICSLSRPLASNYLLCYRRNCDRSIAALGMDRAQRYFASDFDRLSDRSFNASEIAFKHDRLTWRRRS
jgi:hypothetical protein